MDRRELLATGGVSLIVISGCLGTYEVARRTVIPSDDSTDATDDSGESGSNEDRLSGEDGPLVDSGEANETEAGEDAGGTGDDDEGESAETSGGQLEDPDEELTWLERGTETVEEPGYEGGEKFVIGELRNDTGRDLSYLEIAAQGTLDDELVTQNGIEVAGLPAGETLTVEIPLGVESDEMDAFRLEVMEAEYVDSED